MSNIEYGYRPSILFKKGIRNKKNTAGSGSVVAIIGAFPCVSKDILHFKDIETARKELGIVAGVHDVQYKRNSQGVLSKNSNYFYGAGALKQVFLDGKDLQGASEVIICNITTWKVKEADGTFDCDSDGNRKFNVTLKHPEYQTDPLYHIHQKVGFDKLTVAFSKLKKEKFSNLVFAFPLEEIWDYLSSPAAGEDKIEALLRRFRDWTRDTYTVQHPVIGYFGVVTNPTLTWGTSPNEVSILPSAVDSFPDTNDSVLIDETAVEKYLDVFKDERYDIHSLGGFCVEGTYDEDAGFILNPVETVAQYAGFVAGQPVDTPLTQMVMPTVKGTGLIKKIEGENNTHTYEEIFEELNYDSDLTINPDGYKLLKKGATLFECTNRTTQEYSIVSSTLPCGFDLSHIRTSAYIIEQITLNPFLGKINRDTTIQAIDSVVTSIKNSMVERFPIVESIAHSVERVSATCVKIRLHINFYGIIINEIVYVSHSVEGEPRMVGKPSSEL